MSTRENIRLIARAPKFALVMFSTNTRRVFIVSFVPCSRVCVWLD